MCDHRICWRIGRTLSHAGRKRQVAEASKVILTRAVVYSFLSRAFKIEVDRHFLQDIAEIGPTIRILSKSQAGNELEDGNKLLIEFIEQTTGLSGEKRESLLTDLAAEYAALFLGMGPKPVYLVESVHLGSDHLLYEKPYHEIVQAYNSLGYEKEKGFQEPEDHVAVEFDFMAKLCRWTSKILDDGEISNAIAYLNLQKENSQTQPPHPSTRPWPTSLRVSSRWMTVSRITSQEF